MQKLKVYVAGPLGFSESGRHWMKERLLPKLSGAGVEILNPFRDIMGMGTEPPVKSAKATGKDEAMAMGERNIDDIRSADAVLAVLDGADVDSGTAAEIGYAFGLGKPVVGYRGDFRISGDSVSVVVNLQVQVFVEKSGGRIFHSLDEAIGALTSISSAISKSI